MKTRRTILILEILAILMVSGIFAWQLSTLPSLRIQLRSGLHNGLQNIAEDCATTLNERFQTEINNSNRLLSRQLSFMEVQDRNTREWSTVFYPIAAGTPLAEGWFLAVPDRRRRKFKVYDYKKPSRYRKNTGRIGQFRENTNLGAALTTSLNGLLEEGQEVDEYAEQRWSSAVDSSVVFSYSRTFNKDRLMGWPVFYQGTDSLAALVFSQVNDWYFEHVFLRDFFAKEFWTGEEERSGLVKRHLKFGVISNNGDRSIYTSVAFAAQDYEHVVKLADLGSVLSELSVGVGFRDALVTEVADSIYQRNFYLIIGLFVLLIILLALIFLSAIRLLRVSRLKTEFVANVSHEIKTPLSSIKLAADTLKLGRASQPEQQTALYSILQNETERLQHLIYTLLDFSQLESGKKKFQVEEVPLRTWLDQVERYFREQSGSDLEVMDWEVPRGVVSVDRKAMEQVFTIFIDNARKYAEDDPRTQLIIKQKGKRVSIGLRDFGIGIRKQDQGIIFEKFVRLEELDVHNTKGHGIGLSIAKSIVTAMGGKIGVFSRAGEGSTFYVEIPIV